MKSVVVRRAVLAGLFAASLSLSGCAPEGTGTIKVGNPQAVREKSGGVAGAHGKPATAKEAKARQLEEEAAKKNPKLN